MKGKGFCFKNERKSAPPKTKTTEQVNQTNKLISAANQRLCVCTIVAAKMRRWQSVPKKNKTTTITNIQKTPKSYVWSTPIMHFQAATLCLFSRVDDGNHK